MSAHVVVHGDDYTVEGSWDPNDEWDRPDTEFSYSGVDVYASTESDEAKLSSFYSDLFNVDVKPGDEVFVVLCKYSTGDTFGNDGGRIIVMDVLTDSDKADRLVEQLSAVNVRDYSYSATIEGKNYYLPWSGYFEYLEDLFVERAIVRS